MAQLDRRKLLTGASSLFALGAIPASVSGALDPTEKFDLLVRNALPALGDEQISRNGLLPV